MADSLRIYEHAAEETTECLAFRNDIFTPVDIDQWKAMNCTAVTAREGSDLAGFIPLQFREQIIRPGIYYPVVYENAVGVDKDRRGSGIGTKMIDSAAGFMADRVDALMVVRSGERTPGYRFYRKSGHSDLSYAAELVLPAEADQPRGDGHDIQIADRPGWFAAESDLLKLYQGQYSEFGGGRPRTEGYWSDILDSHVFKSRGWKFLIARRGGNVTGYCTGIFGTWQNKEDFCVFEAVAEEDAAMAMLLAEAKAMSISGAVRFPLLSLASPIRKTLLSLGFRAGETTPQLMARVLRPDRMFSRLAADSGLLDSVDFTVVTPHRTLDVHRAAKPRHSVQLDLKEHDLARLFFCRLNLSAALDDETVRWPDRDTALERDLAAVFRFSPWVQWFTDYV